MEDSDEKPEDLLARLDAAKTFLQKLASGAYQSRSDEEALEIIRGHAATLDDAIEFVSFPWAEAYLGPA